MIRLALAAVAAVFTLSPAAAQSQSQRQSHCIALAELPGVEHVHRASFGAPLPDHTARITFVGHATFVLETPEGVTAATDFTGYLGPIEHVPDIVTMNRAHSSHWTAMPDPRIGHVLHGWGHGVEPARHHLVLGDLLVRNVTTDIRGFDGGREADANSIFVFEVAGLCIGHLGHLHHEPSDGQYAALGRLDVVMVPVDGGYTMAQEAMVRVLRRLESAVILPMHWFGEWNLQRFLAAMQAEGFAVTQTGESALKVSVAGLPRAPVVHVLRPAGPRGVE